MPLDSAGIFTRMLSVTAGARAAAGAPGPGTRIKGKAAQAWIDGPWLGLLDLKDVTRAEREVLVRWLDQHAEKLLLVRHLLLARPLLDEVFIELTPQALVAMPEGWRDAPRPVLILSPAGRATPARRREYVDALSRLRIPLTSAGSSLWAIREFDVELMVALAQLRGEAERAAFRGALDPAQRRLFDLQVPAAEAALLDDLVGGRDEESPLALDVESLSSLNPKAHPVAVYAAVERAHNQRRAESERTQFAARTIEARASGQGYPDPEREVTGEFAAQASELLLLPSNLQTLFEASQLLSRE